MALNQQLVDVAKLLTDGINGGGGTARASLGGGGEAFGWTGGLIPTVADYATTATASGMSFPITLVTDSGTPAAIVAAGAPKPAATAITPTSVALDKHAGVGTATLENFLDARGLANAIASVLSAQCLKSFETAAVAALDAAGGTPVTGTDWIAAVAAAQAQLLGNGAKPSVLVLSALDYGAFVADVTGTNGFSQSPDSPVGAILGSPIHVSGSAPAGKAFMFDSSAVVCVQHEASPLVIGDAVSMAATNQFRIVIDLVAATFVASPDGLAEITAPVTAAAAATRKK